MPLANIAREVPPSKPAHLVDAVRQVAEHFSTQADSKVVGELLDVQLVPKGQELAGTSKSWPVEVDLTSGGSLLRLTLSVEAGLTLADLEERFGQPSAAVRAKESMVEFRQPAGYPQLRIIASLLGGVAVAAPVLRIEMRKLTP